MSTEPLFHINQQLGAVQLHNRKRVQFRVYYPRGIDPHVSSINVVGPFREKRGGDDSNYALSKTDENIGTFWELSFAEDLDDGFYEYYYNVKFDDGSSRQVADPCARYGGSTSKSSAFVIGGAQTTVQATPPFQRLPTRDLVIYEMHADDFTKEFRVDEAPFEAIVTKVDGDPTKSDNLAALGINAIEIMPWTPWKDRGFNWGYIPFQYFAVEYSYVNGASDPEEKISKLKTLINECHSKGIHVIFDGVFNHCDPEFPYRQLYRDITASPYTAEDFGGTFGSGFQELDFANICTQDFIRDVCLYWISEFKIDGIRFDAAMWYNVSSDHEHGIRTLIASIDDYLQREKIQNFTMSVEWLDTPASEFVRTSGATSYWDDDLHNECFRHLSDGSNGLSVEYFRSLNNIWYMLKDGIGNANFPNKVPTNYLSNHDHTTVAWQAGWYDGSLSAKWFRTQPHVIALFTSPGCPLFYHGSEMAGSYYLPDKGSDRVIPRPLHWKPADDASEGKLFKLYSTLIEIRKRYPALRSGNFYPAPWEPWMTQFNEQGFGIDIARGLIVFHRYGPPVDPLNGSIVAEKLDLFYVVLNFSKIDQIITLQVAQDGDWKDFSLLKDKPDGVVTARIFRMLDFKVESFWGHILYMQVDA